MLLRMLFSCILVNIILNNVLISGEGVPIFRKDYIYNEKFSSFYKLHNIVSNTWIQAKLKCQQESAVLFYPETKDEAEYVSTAFYKNFKGWIGISDLLCEKEFETVTGVSAESVYCDLEANTWNQNVRKYNLYQTTDGLTENNKEKHCVILNPTSNMETIDCSINLPFLCKKTLNSIVWNDDCNIADSKYIYNRDFDKCYKYHLRPLDWMAAHSTCIAEQSHLAIINSQEEADFLVNMTTEAPKNRYRGPYLAGAVHLGFHNIFRDGYTTVKGYPLIESGYTKWSYNQPDNAGEEEELCGSMFYDGGLNDIHCSDICYFICEHDIDKSTDLDVRSAGKHQTSTQRLSDLPATTAPPDTTHPFYNY